MRSQQIADSRILWLNPAPFLEHTAIVTTARSSYNVHKTETTEESKRCWLTLDYAKLTNDQKVRKIYVRNVNKRFQILEDNNSISSNFIKLRSAVVEAAKEGIPTRKLEKRNKWLTFETFDLMEERTAAKIWESMKYDELKRKIRYMWWCAEEEWPNNEHDLIEKNKTKEPGRLYQ